MFRFRLTLAMVVCIARGLCAALLFAPCARAAGPSVPAPRVVSPEMAPDHRITFRYQSTPATAATKVTLSGEWDSTAAPELTKADNGVWSVTVGPVAPGFWSYRFIVNGVSISDPLNQDTDNSRDSYVSVPSVPPAVWEVRPDVPHGSVVIESHNSGLTGGTRQFYVYTPPGYDTSGSTRYPVLYLLHDKDGLPGDWMERGRVNFMADNLIAAGRMVPMLIVMPSDYGLIRGSVSQGSVIPSGAAGSNRLAPGGKSTYISGYGPSQYPQDPLERYLFEEVIPLVGQKFRVASGRENRALMGFGRGGKFAFEWGMEHPELFASVGAFAPPSITDIDKRFAQDAAGTNARMRLIWFGGGRQDTLFHWWPGWDAIFTRAGVTHTFFQADGTHTYQIARQCFEEAAQKLFQPAAKADAKP